VFSVKFGQNLYLTNPERSFNTKHKRFPNSLRDFTQERLNGLHKIQNCTCSSQYWRVGCDAVYSGMWEEEMSHLLTSEILTAVMSFYGLGCEAV
jgi:hypothetical protein